MLLRTFSEHLKHVLTAAEKQEIADRLARSQQEVEELEEAKAQVVAEFKSKLTALQASIGKDARLYNNGYEHRMVTCDVLYDEPAQGKKTIKRQDTGEIVRVEDMSDNERQRALPFDQETAGVVSSEAPEVEKEPKPEDAPTPALASKREVETAENGGKPAAKPRTPKPERVN